MRKATLTTHDVLSCAVLRSYCVALVASVFQLKMSSACDGKPTTHGLMLTLPPVRAAPSALKRVRLHQARTPPSRLAIRPPRGCTSVPRGCTIDSTSLSQRTALPPPPPRPPHPHTRSPTHAVASVGCRSSRTWPPAARSCKLSVPSRCRSCGTTARGRSCSGKPPCGPPRYRSSLRLDASCTPRCLTRDATESRTARAPFPSASLDTRCSRPLQTLVVPPKYAAVNH